MYFMNEIFKYHLFNYFLSIFSTKIIDKTQKSFNFSSIKNIYIVKNNKQTARFCLFICKKNNLTVNWKLFQMDPPYSQNCTVRR